MENLVLSEGASDKDIYDTIENGSRKKVVHAIFDEFFSNVSINGVRYFSERRRHWSERITQLRAAAQVCEPFLQQMYDLKEDFFFDTMRDLSPIFENEVLFACEWRRDECSSKVFKPIFTDDVCRNVQGFKIILHTPDEVPQPWKRYIQIPTDQVSLISVQP
ncbi:hypothetical protein Bhyg_13516 [Pseudolycoriella hygida]|uniref:Uncharacterized protein n=1 Tax=Pseudolycoriella hygida TaxID=35572 RepID=A0A9Q0MPR8_9DIPT|nr:hypothetical protein Bhyg_13516 [Pseudolycoriella hygida]